MPRYPLDNIQRRKQEDRAAKPVKQWDADKLGCVLETSWHSYRQTVVGSWQMLLDCPAARTSPVFFYLFFSSLVSLVPFPSTTFFLRCSSSGKSTSTLWSFQRTRANDHWKNHESVSLNPILTELERRSRGNGRRFVHARRRLLEKSFAEHARASTRRSLFVHAADSSLFLMFRDFYLSLFMCLSLSFVLPIFLFLYIRYLLVSVCNNRDERFLSERWRILRAVVSELKSASRILLLWIVRNF